jgi:hypothetical protein
MIDKKSTKAVIDVLLSEGTAFEDLYEGFKMKAPEIDFDGNEELRKELKEIIDEVGVEKCLKPILLKKTELLLPTTGKSVSLFAEELGDYFKDKNQLFFRPVLKEVVRLDVSQLDDAERRILGFQEVKSSEFVTLVEKYFDVGSNIIVKKVVLFEKKSMTKEIAGIVLDSTQFRERLPTIEKIFTVPMPLIKDCELTFPKRGYDKNLKSWLPYDSPEIDDNMSLEDAKKTIDEIFKEFCFKGEQDRINAIALLLTPFCRWLYSSPTSRTPLGVYKANRERAGKDYLAGITGIVYEGCSTEEAPISDGKNVYNEEFRKKITSTIMRGGNRIHSSNNKGFLDSAVLEQAITSENWSDRILGRNEMFISPNTLEFSISANIGLTYTTDLSKRGLFINLFLAIEDPNDRKFANPNLHVWIKENRSLVLSSLFSFVKNWVEMGMPSGSHPFASYHEWARIVGGIMESVGYGSPCVSNEEKTSVGGDLEAKDMKIFFELCYEKWKDMWVTKQQMMAEIEDKNSDFSELFSWMDWSEKGIDSARKRFGRMIERFYGREFSGITIFDDGNQRNARKKYMFSKGGLSGRKDDQKTLDM